jgi:hypothetical protein
MEYTANNNAIDHNGYTKNGLFYLASYTAGLRVIDINDIGNQNLTEIAFFDTFPQNDNLSFSGLWNVYPYFDSGNIVLSDINTGFYLVKSSSLSSQVFDSSTSISIYPNPSSEFININSKNENINSVKIFDSLGRLIFTSNEINLNTFTIDVSGFASGLYLININENTNKRLLIK